MFFKSPTFEAHIHTHMMLFSTIECTYKRLIFIPYFVSDSVQLNVGGPFIDLSNLTIPVVFLNGHVSSEANPTYQLYTS